MDLSTAFSNMVNACKAIQLNWDQQETMKRSVEIVSAVVKLELDKQALNKETEALEQDKSHTV